MKSVVVTGAGQGIGRAILDRLLAEDWYVVGIELDPTSADDLRGAVPADRGLVIEGDVSDSAVLEEAATAASSNFRLGGWVNNAGILRNAPMHLAKRTEVQRVIAVNLEATYWGCSAAVRTFVDQGEGGAIVNISSIHGRNGYAEHSAYDMTKGGVDALTRSVAVEYGRLGVRVNAVAPGVVRTPLVESHLTASGDPRKAEAVLARGAPIGRIAEPTEIAAVVSFLLSEAASYVTGQSIAVDGGWTATNSGSEHHEP